jgi:F-type H+-transporting ATPase subunit gamma
VATLREIRRRIRSVKNISHVTRAMQMVAASKMRRAQDQVVATRPYAQRAWDVLTHLAAQRTAEEELHPLLQQRPIETIGLVLITADRGLCGGYNNNIIRMALDFIRVQERPVKLITVGRKGCDQMLRHRQAVIADFPGPPAQPGLSDVTPIARAVLDDFTSGVLDIVFLAYTDFVNILVHRPVVKKLLPLRPVLTEDLALREYVEGERPQVVSEYIYEPDRQTILDTVLLRFTELQVYQAILESNASEHSARMVAMRNATENAYDLIEDLTLTYNRARQEAITREIVDIAGGAEALAKARAMAHSD